MLPLVGWLILLSSEMCLTSKIVLAKFKGKHLKATYTPLHVVSPGWWNGLDKVYLYSPLHTCFHGNRGVLFYICIDRKLWILFHTHILSASCKMMLSDNIYLENYLVCLQVTTRTNQIEGYNR